MLLKICCKTTTAGDDLKFYLMNGKDDLTRSMFYLKKRIPATNAAGI